MFKWRLLLLCSIVATAQAVDVVVPLVHVDYDLMVLHNVLTDIPSVPFKPVSPTTPQPPNEKIEVVDCPSVIRDNTLYINQLNNVQYTSSFGTPNRYVYPAWVKLNNTFIVPTNNLYEGISKTARGDLVVDQQTAQAATAIVNAFKKLPTTATNQVFGKKDELEKAIWHLIEINPYEAPDLLNAVASTNLFSPAYIFNKISLEIAGGRINSASQELDNEIMMQSSNANAFKEELQKKIGGTGVLGKRGVRTESLKKLSESIVESIMYVERLVVLYNSQVNNTFITALDKDLLASNIFCLWCILEEMYNAITKRFNTHDQQLVLNFNGTPNRAESKKITLLDYFKATEQLVQTLKNRYQKGQPKILGIFKQFVTQGISTENTGLDTFIKEYIPLPTDPRNRQETTQYFRTLQSIVRCNYMFFDDDVEKQDIINTLKQVERYARERKLPNAGTFKTLIEVIEQYSNKRKNDEEIAQLFETLDVNPRAYKDTKIIDELIEKIKKTDSLAGMTNEEIKEFNAKKKDILIALEKTKGTIVIGVKLGEQLGEFFTKTCRAGCEFTIHEDLEREIYAHAHYSGADEAEKVLILQSVIAYLADKFYQQSIFTGWFERKTAPIECPTCAYIALKKIMKKFSSMQAHMDKPWLIDLHSYTQENYNFSSQKYEILFKKYFDNPS